MTAEPTWPGVAPNRYYPGCWKSVGISRVPSGLSPSVDSDVDTPMAGMRSATGAERATPAGSVTWVAAGLMP